MWRVFFFAQINKVQRFYVFCFLRKLRRLSITQKSMLMVNWLIGRLCGFQVSSSSFSWLIDWLIEGISSTFGGTKSTEPVNRCYSWHITDGILPKLHFIQLSPAIQYSICSHDWSKGKYTSEIEIPEKSSRHSTASIFGFFRIDIAQIDFPSHALGQHGVHTRIAGRRGGTQRRFHAFLDRCMPNVTENGERQHRLLFQRFSLFYGFVPYHHLQ